MSIRWFFLGAFLLSAVLITVVVLSAPEAALTESVQAGFEVWRADGCAACHTIDGQGGAYAPDLTHIFAQRGDAYLREFLFNPQAYHPGQRIMPTFGLTRDETDALLAYLQWVGEQPAADVFPAHPINVNGGSVDVSAVLSVTSGSAASAADVPTDPVAAGRYWFSRPPANCATCHSLQPGVVVVGPSLAGVASRAGSRIPGMSAEDYIRQSILDPGAFVVPGFPNAMARNLGDVLDSDQINHIIAFLLTLE